MAFGDNMDEGYPDGEKPVHFYYNREERLSNAPKIVKDYYNGTGIHITKGLFKNLVSNKGNRLMLGIVAACTVMVLFVSLFGAKENKATVAAVPLELSAFSYSDEVYVSLKLESTDKRIKGPVPVTAELYVINNDDQTAARQTLKGVYKGSEDFLRAKFTDFDLVTAKADIKIGKEEKTLKTSIIKR